MPVSGKTVKVAVRKTISATARLACTAGQAARFTNLTGKEQAVPPAARAYATAAGPAWVVLGTSQGRRSRCQSSSSGTGRPNY